ncbi:hypothetical protein [Chryseobacterium sp.]|uniref:hypothetical protein n=1 Tax=Chryseobacterium sp. TaxID=1871047 RepID=UPI0025BA3ABE|nr:hypothetical protein [Chryseobacterium sp.]MBV8326790.1 hypothetical protein [Chryseobacterium sp.]
MATYESIIKIKGAVGDLVFYNLNGKNVVRKKSGFNKNAFKKNASYEKVRQNSSEFGHCSKVGKMIRSCLNSYSKEAGDPLLYQKFARLMTEIKDMDIVSERGRRTVKEGLKTEKGKLFLKEFSFGEIPNIGTYISIQDKTITVSENGKADTLIVLTIHPDFENYTAEYAEEVIFPDQQKKADCKKDCLQDDSLLYFVVIKNENEITHMGFV